MSKASGESEKQRLAEWNAGAPIRIPHQRSLLEAQDEAEDWDGPADDDDEEWFDCGWMRSAGCTLAGSEECAFECPHRAALERGLRLTRARMAKRAAKAKEE